MKDFNAGLPEVLVRDRPLQVGFIPVSDCAPLVVAQESGLFAKYELNVELRREMRWAGIRDKVIHGELDAAQAPASLPFITNLGLDSDQCECMSGLVLSLQGNAITVSRNLWNEGVRDAQTLRDVIYRHWGRRTFTFGVVFPHSPAYFILRQWLKSGGIRPDVQVRIVVLPPAQMFPTLKLGYIDGFCSGEPWTSLATEAEAGVCVATSAELAPLHPEKVLMVRSDFAAKRASEHERLCAALIEACWFCDRSENVSLLGEILAQPRYVNAPPGCLERGFASAADPNGAGRRKASGMNIFHGHNANDPTDAKAAWLVNRLDELMEESNLKTPPTDRRPLVKNVFRRDIFKRASGMVVSQAKALNAEAETYSAASGQIA